MVHEQSHEQGNSLQNPAIASEHVNDNATNVQNPAQPYEYNNNSASTPDNKNFEHLLLAQKVFSYLLEVMFTTLLLFSIEAKFVGIVLPAFLLLVSSVGLLVGHGFGAWIGNPRFTFTESLRLSIVLEEAANLLLLSRLLYRISEDICPVVSVLDILSLFTMILVVTLHDLSSGKLSPDAVGFILYTNMTPFIIWTATKDQSFPYEFLIVLLPYVAGVLGNLSRLLVITTRYARLEDRNPFERWRKWCIIMFHLFRFVVGLFFLVLAVGAYHNIEALTYDICNSTKYFSFLALFHLSDTGLWLFEYCFRRFYGLTSVQLGEFRQLMGERLQETFSEVIEKVKGEHDDEANPADIDRNASTLDEGVELTSIATNGHTGASGEGEIRVGVV